MAQYSDDKLNLLECQYVFHIRHRVLLIRSAKEREKSESFEFLVVRNFVQQTFLICKPLAITVVRAAHTTRAEDDDSPADRGTVPLTRTLIPSMNRQELNFADINQFNVYLSAFHLEIYREFLERRI